MSSPPASSPWPPHGLPTDTSPASSRPNPSAAESRRPSSPPPKLEALVVPTALGCASGSTEVSSFLVTQWEQTRKEKAAVYFSFAHRPLSPSSPCPEGGHATALLARSPDAAITWICQNYEKQFLLRFIGQQYAQLGHSEAGQAGKGLLPAKRKRRAAAGTRRGRTDPTGANSIEATNRVLAQLVQDCAATWYQGEEATAPTLDLRLNEHAAYARFLTREPSFCPPACEQIMGIKAIRKAMLIASVGALEALQHAIATWRQQACGLVRPSQPTPSSSSSQPGIPHRMGFMLLEGSEDGMLPPSSQAMVRREASEADTVARFRGAWLQHEQWEHVSHFTDILYRWSKALVWERYLEHQAAVIDQMALEGGGEVSPRTAKTMAKGQLFQALHGQPAPEGSYAERRTVQKWRHFERGLEKAGRWADVQQTLSAGVFALIHKDEIPHSFIEETLPKACVKPFCRMVKACNTRAAGMLHEAEQLVINVLRERRLPPSPLQLEVEDIADMQDRDLATILQPYQDYNEAEQAILASQQALQDAARLAGEEEEQQEEEEEEEEEEVPSDDGGDNDEDDEDLAMPMKAARTRRVVREEEREEMATDEEQERPLAKQRKREGDLLRKRRKERVFHTQQDSEEGSYFTDLDVEELVRASGKMQEK